VSAAEQAVALSPVSITVESRCRVSDLYSVTTSTLSSVSIAVESSCQVSDFYAMTISTSEKYYPQNRFVRAERTAKCLNKSYYFG